MADNDSFDVLISKAKAGDLTAIGLLVSQCQDYLLAIANADIDENLRARVAASDMVQESMLVAQQNIADFRGNSDREFAGWLRGILINQIRDQKRYHNRQKREVGRDATIDGNSGQRIELKGDVYTPGTNAVHNEESKILQAAMAKLPDEYQTVLQLRNWQELSFDKIGELMKRSPEAARKLWARALFKLQKTVAEMEK